ncbi:MAG TPA: YfhO family protein, partial [Chloroflexota bacterium]|nr:YfhO family protein [Chloroflexota bacterium]
VEPDRERVFERLHESGFDPRRTVLIEQGQPLPARESTLGEARVTRQTSGELVVNVTARESAVLVLSEVFYPGWVADLNGQRVPLLRANYLFRAVQVPPGDHVVRVRFEPQTWVVGRAVSAISWLVLVTLAFWSTLRPLKTTFLARSAGIERPIVARDGT